MDSKFAIALCVLLLSAAFIEAQGSSGGRRCLCKKLSKNLSENQLVKIEIFPISSRCEKVEYVATMKRQKKQKCLHPKSKILKKMISEKGKIKVIKHE